MKSSPNISEAGSLISTLSLSSSTSLDSSTFFSSFGSSFFGLGSSLLVSTFLAFSCFVDVFFLGSAFLVFSSSESLLSEEVEEELESEIKWLLIK